MRFPIACRGVSVRVRECSGMTPDVWPLATFEQSCESDASQILQGGRRGGRDISDQPNGPVQIGREYPVLGIVCQAETGVAYSILREDVYPALAPSLLTAEMFEVVNPTIPSSWVVVDWYGNGRVIGLEPKAWADDVNDEGSFFERKVNGDGSLIPVLVHE